MIRKRKVMAICAQCSKDIPESEVQKCERCGMDGLGNCCIGEADHPCVDDEAAKAEQGDA